VATFEDVAAIALALPETTETPQWGSRSWRVKNQNFVWERPLRKSDLAALGADAPDGPILGIRTDGLDGKEALLADDPAVFFTTPHFDGYPAVLARLELLEPDELRELILDAWFARAPKRLAAAYLAQHGER
jgi:hypothetical protein